MTSGKGRTPTPCPVSFPAFSRPVSHFLFFLFYWFIFFGWWWWWMGWENKETFSVHVLAELSCSELLWAELIWIKLLWTRFNILICFGLVFLRYYFCLKTQQYPWVVFFTKDWTHSRLFLVKYNYSTLKLCWVSLLFWPWLLSFITIILCKGFKEYSECCRNKKMIQQRQILSGKTSLAPQTKNNNPTPALKHNIPKTYELLQHPYCKLVLVLSNFTVCFLNCRLHVAAQLPTPSVSLTAKATAEWLRSACVAAQARMRKHTHTHKAITVEVIAVITF